MFTLTTIIIASLVSLLVGSILGVLLSGNLGGNKKNNDTEARLAQTEETLVNYQRDVAEHFAQTTELVNTLTESYRDMHEHLSNSALKLSTPEISRQLLSSENQLPGANPETSTIHQEVQAPRDWAPKRQGQEGTLSEKYGLENEPLDGGDSQKTEPSPDTPQA